MILPIHPQTDLIEPKPAITSSTPFSVRRVVIRAIAAYLGITPVMLRAELASGLTLNQVARRHGKNIAGLRQAVQKRLREQAAQLLR